MTSRCWATAYALKRRRCGAWVSARGRAEEQYETLIGRLPSFAWATLARRIATGLVRSRRRSPRSMHGGSDLSARVGRRRGGKSGLDQAATSSNACAIRSEEHTSELQSRQYLV